MFKWEERIRQWPVTDISGWTLVNESSHIWLTVLKWIVAKWNKADSLWNLNRCCTDFIFSGVFFLRRVSDNPTRSADKLVRTALAKNFEQPVTNCRGPYGIHWGFIGNDENTYKGSEGSKCLFKIIFFFVMSPLNFNNVYLRLSMSKPNILLFFFTKYSTYCHLYIASAWLLLVVQKMASQ